MSADPVVIVLAGRRADAVDAVAAAAGVSHKCVAPVAGEPMILHVVRTAVRAFPSAPVLLSIDDPQVATAIPEIAQLVRQGRVGLVAAKRNIVDSIVTAARALPAIVTTADNVLLSAAALREIARAGARSGADAAVALAPREAVLAAHPDGQRRFYAFRDGAFSNCNLYWLGSPRALRAAEAFRGGGQFAKHPARIAAAFGLLNLLRFRLRFDTADRLIARVGRRFGVDLRAVVLTDGRQAIDVDNDRTLRVVEALLANRAASAAAEPARVSA